MIKIMKVSSIPHSSTGAFNRASTTRNRHISFKLFPKYFQLKIKLC